MSKDVILKQKAITNAVRHGVMHLGLTVILCFSAASFGQGDIPEAGAAQPAPPPTLEHMPSQLPSVTFHNGELTIVAYNSTLHDVLEMVRTQTRAAMDIPSEATERVFVNLGPGPIRRVLDLLLAGSSFNYVLLGSETDPQALTKVVLSPKPTGSAEAGTVAETTAQGRRRIESARARRPQAAEDVEESTPLIQQASESAANTDSPTNPVAKPEDLAKTEGQEKVEAAADLGSQPAAGSQPPVEYPRTPNIKTAQEVLQDLYARRQAMQQHQSSPQ